MNKQKKKNWYKLRASYFYQGIEISCLTVVSRRANKNESRPSSILLSFDEKKKRFRGKNYSTNCFKLLDNNFKMI